MTAKTTLEPRDIMALVFAHAIVAGGCGVEMDDGVKSHRASDIAQTAYCFADFMMEKRNVQA
jgi:hypothetical protein